MSIPPAPVSGRLARHPFLFALLRLIGAAFLFVILLTVLSLGTNTIAQVAGWEDILQATASGETSGDYRKGALPGLILEQFVQAAAALLTLVLMGRGMERRRPLEFGLPLAPRQVVGQTAAGFAAGAGYMALVVGILAAAGWYRVTGAGDASPGMFLLVTLLFLLVAISEEVLMRGLLLRISEEGVGSYLALLISALFFGLAHLGNANASPIAGFAIAAEAGLLLGAVYLLTRSLWAPIGLHWAWNLFEGSVFGTPVSGQSLPTLLSGQLTGPALWTGGVFGPEAGLIAAVLGILLGLLCLTLAARRGLTVPPPWMQRHRGATSDSEPEDAVPSAPQ